MTINYHTAPPTEDGFYVVEVNGELGVAEAMVDHNGDVTWYQTGADYDVWQHSPAKFEILVHRKIDLEAMVNPDD